MGGVRKQFRILGGAPVIVQTLRALTRCKDVDAIVVATPAGDSADWLEAGLRVSATVSGGGTRQESVARAMAVLPPEAGIVLVHDAVRPFIETQAVSAVIAAARTAGAAALAAPAVDTMRYGSGGLFNAAVSRSGLYLMQTPQGFRRRVLEEAMAAAESVETDEVALVQRMNHPVTIVPGCRSNIKITTQEDWEWAATQWPCWEARQQ